jgi:hypothetical protein
VDQNGRNVEDGRVVVVAAQTILTWAFDKPPDYDPREDKPPVTFNLAVLSTEEKRALLDMLRRGLVTEAEAAPPAGEIEGRAERTKDAE